MSQGLIGEARNAGVSLKEIPERWSPPQLQLIAILPLLAGLGHINSINILTSIYTAINEEN